MSRWPSVLILEQVGEDMMETAPEGAVARVGAASVPPVSEMMHVAQRGLRSHPGQVQCRSRTMTARLMAVGMTLVRRPTSMISPSGPSTIRLSEQSQARVRSSWTVSMCPSSVS